MSRFVLTAQLQLQAPTNTRQVVSQIQRQLQGGVNLNINVRNGARAQTQVSNLTRQVNSLNTAGQRMGRTFGVALRRFAAFSVASRGVSLFTSSLGDAFSEAIKFERELVKVSQVTGKTLKELDGLSRSITRLSTGLGVSSKELLSTTRILAQAGIQAKDLDVALSALAKTSLAPTFENIEKTAEGAVAILAQFGQGVGALEKQLGAINSVAGKFAVESGDLISAIRRTGGVFKAAGGDLNELLGLFTSIRATTRESAESIATGLRTIFTRIQRPKTIEFLKRFGVELTDIEGKFVGPFEAVRRLSDALSGLGERDIRFVQIAEELGGFRQIGKVIPLLQQFETAERARQAAIAGGTSLNKDYVTAQKSLAVQFTRVREEFLALVRGISETGTFQILIKTTLALTSQLIKLADAFKPILPLIGAFAAFKIARGAGSFLSGIGAGISRRNMGGPIGFASGGVVPGSGNRDTVPAMLTPGEFVVSKKAAQSIGPANLDRMNKKGVQGFAKGGPVGRVQKFANGGDVRESALGGYDMVKPFIALSAVLPAMQAGFEGLNGASQELEEGFNAAKVGANAGLGAATMMAMALDIAAKNMEKQKQKREKEGDAIDDVTSEAEVLKSALAESTKAIEEQKVALEEAEKSLGEAEVTELSVDADSISVASIDSFILQNELSIQAQSVVLHGDRVSDAAGADAASARAANPASVAEIQNLEQSTAFSEQRLKDIGRPLTKDKGTLIGSSFSRTEGINEKIKQEEKRLNRKNVSDTTRADAEANIKALNQQLEEEKQVRRDLRSEMQQHRETIVENKSKIEDLKAAQEEAAQAAADAAKQAEAAAQAVDLFGDAAEDITLAPLNEDLVNKNVAATNPEALAKAETDAILAQARAADTKASIDPGDAPTPRMFFKGRAERNAATFRERRERVIAEGNALGAEIDAGAVREERFDKALKKRQQITQDLRAERDATPKGDLPNRERLQKEINKSIAAEKAIIKKKKEILRNWMV